MPVRRETFGHLEGEVVHCDKRRCIVSRVTAAPYDNFLGEWLPELSVPSGALSEGDAKSA
jgi:hypothetical protein